ncbi:hypothetical protein Dsin_030132 [Dipteronia sinensis]|uniref:Uncharacterized protein n=1 Tax=Dipteronia sinensis TaxID=43782 RepID=A0AAD9ZIP4_9ROSI|nr:hypothetical protein Dsin_030132 [Dipteronia sinensis]
MAEEKAAASAGFNKAKAAASIGAQKVKIGTSVGQTHVFTLHKQWEVKHQVGLISGDQTVLVMKVTEEVGDKEIKQWRQQQENGRGKGSGIGRFRQGQSSSFSWCTEVFTLHKQWEVKHQVGLISGDQAVLVMKMTEEAGDKEIKQWRQQQENGRTKGIGIEVSLFTFCAPTEAAALALSKPTDAVAFASAIFLPMPPVLDLFVTSFFSHLHHQNCRIPIDQPNLVLYFPLLVESENWSKIGVLERG